MRDTTAHLIDTFPAAARRIMVRENPSLGVLPLRVVSTLIASVTSASALLIEAMGREILRVLEVLVDLFVEANGLDNPLVD